MREELLKKYAHLAVKIGTNVQKGQLLRINGPVEAYPFLHLCAEEAYKCGAGEVIINFDDNHLTLLKYQNESVETLKEVPQFSIDRMQYYIDKGSCQLSVSSPDPDLLKDVDPTKIAEVMKTRGAAFKRFHYYTTNNIGQWSIVAYPNIKWAKKVFPDLSEEEAVDKLWDSIFQACRVDEENDIDEVWNEHHKALHEHCALLNGYAFKELHFKNALGTDLTVGLIKDHIWEGGSDHTPKGVEFSPNIPTEEVFTMPDRFRIEGEVYATKPLSYSGQIIDGFHLTFQAGRVVAYDAKTNKEALGHLLDTDEGSRSLGEVALISHNSPISNANILFYNTLFDENASCHLALGACYPTNVKNGVDLSEEELYAKGGNHSINHVDFMFGSADMEVIGTTYDGQKVSVFKDGNFVI